MNNSALPKHLRGITAALALGLAAQTGQAQTIYGLATTAAGGAITSSLVTFQATAPGTLTATLPITGVAAGQVLVGLDSRPNTGELFALGYNAASTTVQLYRLAPVTGAATAVGSALTLNLGTNTSRVGFDFNPTVDRIRLTGSNGTNFRLNPVTGGLAATDTNLAYAATDANAGQTPAIGAVAYTNSYIGATATALYNIDETGNRLTLQNPPNNGVLNTVGSLGTGVVTGGSITDLDISFNPTMGTNTAYLLVGSGTGPTPGGNPVSTLYTVNLGTGATTSVGPIGPTLAGSPAITDLAVQITRMVPAAVTGQLVYALAGTNLLTFDSALPGTVRTSLGITGLPANQVLVGMDVRPLTNSLYLLGYDATAQTGQIYTLDAASGALRAINATPMAMALGAAAGVSFDFNPTVDRIRVTSANGLNLRLNPIDGSVAATDMNLAFAAGDANATRTPAIGAVAYTNSFNGATTTSLFNYDQALNIITLQNPPNNGTLNTVGSTGLTLNAAPEVDMDIFYNPTGATNTAYLVANSAASVNSVLYTLNTTTGTPTAVGLIGNGLTVRDIAVAGAAGVTGTRSSSALAAGLSLAPNPSQTGQELAIHFTLPQRAGTVEVAVYSALGQQVTTLSAPALAAGPQVLRWQSAAGLAPGLYLFQLRLDGQPAGTAQGVLR